MRATLRRMRIVTLLAAAAIVLPTSPATAVDITGLRVARTDAPDVSAPEFVLPLPAGGQATRSVTVTNTSAQDVTVLVYGADAAIGDQGLEVADGTDNELLGAWLLAETPTLEIPAGATRIVAFTVTRPAGDEDGGIGAVVVQLDDASRGQLNLPTAQRAAIPVRVSPDGVGEGLLIGTVAIEDGEAVVEVSNPTPSDVLVAGEVTSGGGEEPTVVAVVPAGTTIAAGDTTELRLTLAEDAGASWLLRPALTVRDDAGVLRGPVAPLPARVRAGGAALLAVAAFLVARAARRRQRQLRARSQQRPPPLGAPDAAPDDAPDVAPADATADVDAEPNPDAEPDSATSRDATAHAAETATEVERDDAPVLEREAERKVPVDAVPATDAQAPDPAPAPQTEAPPPAAPKISTVVTRRAPAPTPTPAPDVDTPAPADRVPPVAARDRTAPAPAPAPRTIRVQTGDRPARKPPAKVVRRTVVRRVVTPPAAAKPLPPARPRLEQADLDVEIETDAED